MSNLYKQRYVINLEDKKVVINSDDKYLANTSGQQMSSLVFPEVGVMPEYDEYSDGFTEGLDAEEVYAEPQPDPEEILAMAREEAESILAQARAEAAKITNDASHQAEILYEHKRQEGYKTGVEQCQEEFENEKLRIQNEYDQLTMALQQEYEQKLDTMEHDIVEVMIRVFNKVFNIQFDNKKQIILHLIKNTLLGIDDGKVFHIRVAEANFKFIESHVADIREKIGNDVNIDVVNDLSLDEDDCVIETEHGVYNCGMNMVLTNLEKDIRSLCS